MIYPPFCKSVRLVVNNCTIFYNRSLAIVVPFVLSGAARSLCGVVEGHFDKENQL
jgi:hypothetical protein